MKKKSKEDKKVVNKLILKSRRKRLKKKIVASVILLSIGTMIFITKSGVFTIKRVTILGNPMMSGDDVKSRTEYLYGQNLFFINKGDIINEAEKNPYVDSVTITKTFPKQVNIEITEKAGVYYIEKDGEYYVLSDKAVLLEKTGNIDNRNLIDITGINVGDIELGQTISGDGRVTNFLYTFSEIVKMNPSNYIINSINLGDLMNIRVYIEDVEGRIGNDENIPDKMNKLIHIIENEEINIKKGYIDVGFDGAPVYYKEN